MKCKGCKYYYKTMFLKGFGYNPYPFCHLFEEEGKRCNPLTFECFKSRKNQKSIT